MKRIFFGVDQRLRAGWWVLVFFAFVAVTRVIHTPVNAALKSFEWGWLVREPLPFALIMLATWACLRLRRETFADAGFKLDRIWLQQFAAGAGLGLCMMLAIAGSIWSMGGVRFELSPTASIAALGKTLYIFLFVALFEEALFRGFAFQRLIGGIGFWPAQIGLALLFAAGHFGNPGMEGATRVWATLDLFLGAILFGLAYVRTNSLALPVGLHLTWNWTQGALLGFGVSGYNHASWLQPVFQGKAEWLTGGSFGPEASVMAVIVDVIVLVALWRWKGSASAARAGAASPAVVKTAPAVAAAT